MTQLVRKWNHDNAKAAFATPSSSSTATAEKVALAAAAGPSGWGIVPKMQNAVMYCFFATTVVKD